MKELRDPPRNRRVFFMCVAPLGFDPLLRPCRDKTAIAPLAKAHAPKRPFSFRINGFSALRQTRM